MRMPLMLNNMRIKRKNNNNNKCVSCLSLFFFRIFFFFLSIYTISMVHNTHIRILMYNYNNKGSLLRVFLLSLFVTKAAVQYSYYYCTGIVEKTGKKVQRRYKIYAFFTRTHTDIVTHIYK